MLRRLLPVLYAIEFFLSLIAVYTVWGELGGQDTSITCHGESRYWLRHGGYGSPTDRGIRTCRASARWRIAIWLVILAAFGICAGLVTYYYQVNEPPDEENAPASVTRPLAWFLAPAFAAEARLPMPEPGLPALPSRGVRCTIRIRTCAVIGAFEVTASPPQPANGRSAPHRRPSLSSGVATPQLISNWGKAGSATINAFAATPGHPKGEDTPYRTFDPSAGILRCFACHSTGPLTLAAGKNIVPHELGVRCEACHGPSGDHARDPRHFAAENPGRYTSPRRSTRSAENVTACRRRHRDDRSARSVERAPSALDAGGRRLLSQEQRKPVLPDLSFAARSDRPDSGAL